MSGVRAPRKSPRGNRYFKGSCAHVAWYAIAEDPAAAEPELFAQCPACGPVALRSAEPWPATP